MKAHDASYNEAAKWLLSWEFKPFLLGYDVLPLPIVHVKPMPLTWGFKVNVF